MNPPKTVPPVRSLERTKWWEAWVNYVRNRPGFYDEIGEENVFWGEHLFIGCETHNNLSRAPRAFGRQDSALSDNLEYHEVTDLRVWSRTAPNPLLLHERILGEHCYIVGPSGSGKSSLGIAPLLIQLMRGAKIDSDTIADPYPVVVIDLKGDPALFHTVRIEAEQRGQTFQFFTLERDTPTYRFNPFRGFDRGSRSVSQLCQLILDSLSLNHGKGYGRSYYTERSRHVLARTLKRKRDIQSFDELHVELKETVAKSDIRTKGDAFELLSVIETMTEYRQLVTDPEETIQNTQGIIFMPSVLKDRTVAYFHLPAALESISVGEIAKLVVFNLRVAAQDWKRANPTDPREVILVIDELQRVAGENLQGILQDARAFGIHAILANQSLSDLKSPTGFDLAPTLLTNTRTKFFFTSPSERECYVYVERGKGFTEARQFPQKGNPWLRDLAPEEFAYHVELAWPVELEEFKRREAMPWPTWAEVPGGTFYKEEIPEEVEEEEVLSELLPRNFKLLRDEEWEEQVALIQDLFTPDPELSVQEEDRPGNEELTIMKEELLASIADRGPDRTRCILALLFDNYENGVETAPTWKDLWAHCWKEPLPRGRGAEVQPAAAVRQSVYRAKEALDRYFMEGVGIRFRLQGTIESTEYKLKFIQKNEIAETEPPSGEGSN